MFPETEGSLTAGGGKLKVHPQPLDVQCQASGTAVLLSDLLEVLGEGPPERAVQSSIRAPGAARM